MNLLRLPGNMDFMVVPEHVMKGWKFKYTFSIFNFLNIVLACLVDTFNCFLLQTVIFFKHFDLHYPMIECFYALWAKLCLACLIMNNVLE